MKRALAAMLVVGLLAALAMPVKAQSAIIEQEAHAIGADAYLYFYPQILMDLARKQSTNIEPCKEIAKGPMNMSVSAPTCPPADLKLLG
jgi:hypothetical protein